jgi:3-(3-hydroxy-phenyl)propionate hydroxylase
MLMPGDDPDTLVQPDTLWSLVARWVRPDQATLERAAIYTFHSVIAQGWRGGRLLLAGDAAHQTPPFLGQGMCAGVRDAANLAWKLAAVVRGSAGDSLLDSYESERSPHVRAVIGLAVRLGDIIQTTDPEQARARDQQFASGQPVVFETPAPALTLESAGPPHPQLGRPFPQPVLADGSLLDEQLGTRFAVIGQAGVLQAADAATRERWHLSQALVLEAQDPALSGWLETQQVQAVLVRPDRYIAGVALSVDELAQISAHLPA